jgi:hypothetical protein
MRVRKLEKRPWRMGTMILRMTSILPSIPLEKRGFLRRMGFMEGTPSGIRLERHKKDEDALSAISMAVLGSPRNRADTTVATQTALGVVAQVKTHIIVRSRFAAGVRASSRSSCKCGLRGISGGAQRLRRGSSLPKEASAAPSPVDSMRRCRPEITRHGLTESRHCRRGPPARHGDEQDLTMDLGIH